jgi:hypothetical protein
MTAGEYRRARLCVEHAWAGSEYDNK